MRLPKTLLCCCVLALAGASGLLRADSGPYIRGFDALALLPPPPAVGSPEDRVDRDSAFQVYAARTPADLARAKAEHDVSMEAFAPVIGAGFTQENYPRTAALVDEVLAETKPVVDSAKKRWNRPRPYILDPVRFNHPGDVEKSGGYPSGHSTRGTVLALVLAQVFPAKRDAILAQGRLIGWTRVEAGLHTPLDIYGGRVLGQALARAMGKSPGFQRDLASAVAEAASAVPDSGPSPAVAGTGR